MGCERYPGYRRLYSLSHERNDVPEYRHPFHKGEERDLHDEDLRVTKKRAGAFERLQFEPLDVELGQARGRQFA